MTEKRSYNEFVGKLVVTKEGKRLGSVSDITFEARAGELLHIVLKDATNYVRGLNLETSQGKEVLIPFNSIMAIGDFIVVSEEDII